MLHIEQKHSHSLKIFGEADYSQPYDLDIGTKAGSRRRHTSASTRKYT